MSYLPKQGRQATSLKTFSILVIGFLPFYNLNQAVIYLGRYYDKRPKSNIFPKHSLLAF